MQRFRKKSVADLASEAEILEEIEKLEREEYKRLKAIEKYQIANKIKYFVPHPKQELFFEAVRNILKKVIIFQGGNRSGKTTSLIVALTSLLLGKQPWDGTALRYKAPIRARLFGEDWTHHVGQVLIPKLNEWVPRSEVEWTKKNNQGIDYLWKFKNGSELEVMTYEQKTDSVEGWAGHVVAADEPMPRDKFVANKRGLVDYDGVFLMSFTPLKEAWIKDELIDSGDQSIASFHVEISDNPYLTKEAIEEFEKSLTEDERAARISGKWLHLQGLVYKDFDKEKNWIKPVPITGDYTVYCAIDTHPRTEQALMFMAVNSKGEFYIIKEIFQHGKPEDVADWVIEFDSKIHKVFRVVIEPGSKGDSNRGESQYDVISKRLAPYGIVLDLASKDRDSGILAVKESLKSKNGTTSLFVFNNCPRTLYEFTHYVWEDWKNKESRNEKNKPKDKDDHMMENLYRLCLIPPIHYDAKLIQPFRLAEIGVT